MRPYITFAFKRQKLMGVIEIKPLNAPTDLVDRAQVAENCKRILHCCYRKQGFRSIDFWHILEWWWMLCSWYDTFEQMAFFDTVIRSHNSSSAKDQIGTAMEQEKLNAKALYLISSVLFTIKTIKVG